MDIKIFHASLLLNMTRLQKPLMSRDTLIPFEVAVEAVVNGDSRILFKDAVEVVSIKTLIIFETTEEVIVIGDLSIIFRRLWNSLAVHY